MSPLEGRVAAGTPVVVAPEVPVLVNVPILEVSTGAESTGNDNGKKGSDKGSELDGRKKVVAGGTGDGGGGGGPIRREKVKRKAVLDRGGPKAGVKKNSGGGTVGAGKGVRIVGALEGELGEKESYGLYQDSPRVCKDQQMLAVGGQAPGTTSGVGGSSPSSVSGLGLGRLGKGGRQGDSRPGPASPGGPEGPVVGASAGKSPGHGGRSRAAAFSGSPPMRSPVKGGPQRSPSCRAGSLPGGRAGPGGSKEGKEGTGATRHGELVKKIKNALLASVGGDEEESGGGRGGGDTSSQ